MPAPNHLIRRRRDAGAQIVGELHDLTAHRQVCLHTEDAELIRLLEVSGLIAPTRPPYLDAAREGVHGQYRPKPQINLFFDPPIDDVARVIADAGREAGYTVEEVAPTSA